ncbi:quinon protein alcohol dehydrogenase-like superfamily [Mycena amicta]|nr:quinon protein alcohol dehydrogenase-like superfamily [Mycena amicta]
MFRFPTEFFRTPYIQHRGVKRHQGNITNLAVSSDSKFLATAGSSGTRVYKTSSLKKESDEPEDVLYSGTSEGFIFAWRFKEEVRSGVSRDPAPSRIIQAFEEVLLFQIEPAQEISCFAFDPVNNRLAVGTRQDRVQSWKVTAEKNATWLVEIVFDKTYDLLGPQAIAFDDHGKDRDIFVFGLYYPGPVWTLRGSDGKFTKYWNAATGVGSIARHRRQGGIGGIAENSKDGLLCIDDIYAGPSLFRMSDMVKTHTMEIPSERETARRPRQVQFIDRGRGVASGSDHGKVFLFDVRTGKKLQTMSLKSKEWVQAIAAGEVNGVPTIFAAQTRANEGDEEIMVWKRARRVEWKWIENTLKVVVLVGFLVFFYQNVVLPAIPAATEVPTQAPVRETVRKVSTGGKQGYKGVSVIRA